LRQSDERLVSLVWAELATLLQQPGLTQEAPVASRVVRWGGALPQYAPGHLGRVAVARQALAEVPTLTLAGAAYDGVGIPACIASGEAAADQLLGSLA
jgi:oxygen-dependent protoporphyrinogen oxidase